MNNTLKRGGALLLLSLLVSCSGLRAQSVEVYGADAVVSMTPGIGAGFGADALPKNILGPPDKRARITIPTVDPEEIVALGLGGEIVLRFDRVTITDGPGADFTVFENAFAYTLGPTERIYAEPGEVSVSRDGITWFTFPFDSTTLIGCAGRTPTNGDQDPANPEVSGGDGFDLADIGVDSVRYVRIRDVTSIVKENRSHPFYDVTLSGFDLDAIVAAHSVLLQPAFVEEGSGNEPQIGEKTLDHLDLR